MRELADILEGQGCAVRWVAVPGGKPRGWDCVDATEADIHQLIREASSSVRLRGDGTDELFPTMAAFLDMDLSPPEFLIADMLPVGGIGIVAAKPDVGKSTLLRTLAVAVAKGDSWLGRSVKQGPVLLCQFEEIAPFARDHLVQMGATRETPIFPFMGSRPESFPDILASWAARHRPALIIMDTLAKAAPECKDWNALNDVESALAPFLAIARSNNAAMLFAHWNKKSESMDAGDDLMGSTAIRGNMDHTLAITLSGEKRTIKTVSQRYGEPLPPTYLEIDPVTGRVEGAGTVKEKTGDNIEAEILAVLADGQCNGEELEKRVTGRGKTIRHIRDTMVERGDIHRTKVGQAFIYSSSVPSHS